MVSKILRNLAAMGGYAGAAALVLMTSPDAATAQNQRWAKQGAVADTIELSVDEARAIPVFGSAVKVFVANPEIADVEASDATRVVVYGRKRGETTVLITTRSGLHLKYRVVVGRSVQQLMDNLNQLFPNSDLVIYDAPKGMTITGSTANAGDAEKVRKMASQYLGDNETLNFNVRITGGEQVNLHVRIVEVARSVSETLGINLAGMIGTGSTQIGVLTGRAVLPTVAATGTATVAGPPTADSVFSRSNLGLSSLGIKHSDKAGTLAGTIDALKAKNLLRVLAEPNLTALSGETADFLAGGEIAVPVVNGSGTNQQVTIEWKDFGVSLKFTPVIVDANMLTVKVSSEVSELSDVGSTKIGSFTIPSISTRRVETTVKLSGGQSFAIAGLYNDRQGRSVEEVPGLGSIPILGELFRSRSFKSSKTELIVIVTPYIATPVDGMDRIALPEGAVVPDSSPLIGRPANNGPSANNAPSANASPDQPQSEPNSPTRESKQ